MSDLALDTSFDGGDGFYRATLSRDWEVWGPNGGYLSSIALRAAGDYTRLPRPTSYSCHYLNVATFDEVEITIRQLRSSPRAVSVRIDMQQRGRAILEALVWVTEEGPGLEHDFAALPGDVRPGEGFLWTQKEKGAPIALWRNLEGRMVGWPEDRRWETRAPGDPQRLDWFRFKPRATFEDPYLDACRSLILIDTMMFPAAALAYGEPMDYIAPSLDLSVQFHRPAPDDKWLLCESSSPIAEGGLVAGTARIWSGNGKLVASGAQQMLSTSIERLLARNGEQE
jgi:acyl-CoA thioesterase II